MTIAGTAIRILVIAIGLALTLENALAQYTGIPGRRDVYGQPCSNGPFSGGSGCADTSRSAAPNQSVAPNQDDWRKTRQLDLEERARTTGQRQRDNDWRVQRQREQDDRFAPNYDQNGLKDRQLPTGKPSSIRQSNEDPT